MFPGVPGILYAFDGRKWGKFWAGMTLSPPKKKKSLSLWPGVTPVRSGNGLQGIGGKIHEAVSLLKSIESGPAEDVLHKAEEYARKEDLQEILDLWLLIYRNRLF